jgi:hypothetical protein
MRPPAVENRFVIQLCLGAMSVRVPQLRAALHRSDESAVRGLAGELRNTLGLLGLPRLFQLSQEIEYRRAGSDPETWNGQCHHFCSLLENIHWSLQQQMAQN